jgi:hypothetical protein
MSALYKKVELIANVAIILVAIMIGVVLVQRFFFAKTAQPPQTVALGSKVSLSGVEWTKNGKTLLLALQVGCRFCSESAPFYQRVVETANSKGVKVVAVLPQPPTESENYLRTLAIPISDVRQASLESLSVGGTPTLILVNEKGEVAGAWVGKLPGDKEAEVLSRL